MTKTKSLRAKYNEEVKAAMKEKFGYENDMMIPKLHIKHLVVHRIFYKRELFYHR